jgi:hypothetical protein
LRRDTTEILLKLELNTNQSINQSIQYVDKIIVSYTLEVKDKLNLPLAQKVLVILDFFSAQLGEDFHNYMLSIKLVYVYVTPNCTSKLQPMNLSMQKCVKDRMRSQFEDYYADKLAKNLQDKTDVVVDLRMASLKPLSAKWIMSTIDYLKANPKIVFKSLG